MMREESKASPIRCFVLSAVCLRLILCLASCSAPPSADDPQPRILSPLTPGEYKPYVELSDGYLHFNYDERLWLDESGPARGEFPGEVSVSYAQEILEFDIESVCAYLPEHLRFTWEHLVSPARSYKDEHGIDHVSNGVSLELIGESLEVLAGTPTNTQKLILRFSRDGYIEHVGWKAFEIYPWIRCDPEKDEDFEFTCERSLVGVTEVGLCHAVQYTAVFPDCPNEIYYAGFYVGDLAITLESHYGYCTQEEFIEVLLAILDAAVASTE